MYILPSVHVNESGYKVTECIFHCVDISRKVKKVGSVYITGYISEVKLPQSYVVYISLRVHLKERRYKGAESICHCAYSSRKVVIKLPNVYNTACTSQGKLFNMHKT